MKTQVGIWIDTKKAILVSLGKSSENVEVIDSGIVTRERFEGESKVFGRFGDQYLNSEGSKDERLVHQTRTYLQTVASKLSKADEFVIFGPAGMKVELKKVVESDHSLSPKLIGVETADSMTDNQVAAWVREYFEN